MVQEHQLDEFQKFSKWIYGRPFVMSFTHLGNTLLNSSYTIFVALLVGSVFVIQYVFVGLCRNDLCD